MKAAEAATMEGRVAVGRIGVQPGNLEGENRPEAAAAEALDLAGAVSHQHRRGASLVGKDTPIGSTETHSAWNEQDRRGGADHGVMEPPRIGTGEDERHPPPV